MEISLFPPLFAKQKEAELNEYIQSQTKEANAVCEDLKKSYQEKMQKLDKKYRFVDDGFGTYLKTMLIVYACIFAAVGLFVGPLIMNASGSMPESIALVILYNIGAAIIGAITGALCTLAGILPLLFFSIVISPIAYFLIYKPVCNRRNVVYNEKRHKLQNELDAYCQALAVPFLADIEVRRKLMEEEIAQYNALFEEQALFMKNQFGENPLVGEITAWLSEKYLAHLRSLKRTADTETVETAFSFTVYKTKITAMKEDFKFADHRVKNLDEDIDKMALALAVMIDVNMTLVHSDEYYELGDDVISFAPSHTYLANPNSPAVRIDFTYSAKNKAFVPVQDWVAPPNPITETK